MAPRGGGQSTRTREAGGAGGGTPRVGFTVRADVRKRFILLSGAPGWSPAGAGGAGGGRDGDSASRPAVPPPV